ncbi:MAG: glycosyltransferase [Candidatus Sungbacteria bacterium]|nr:glycosyltransferase [Candidatus Sungbacteria bacterium]
MSVVSCMVKYSVIIPTYNRAHLLKQCLEAVARQTVPHSSYEIGIKRAKGEIIFFTDDDCVVPKNWIETLADGYLRHSEVAGVGGWYEYSEELYAQSFYINYTMLWLQKRFDGAIAKKIEVKNNNFFLNPAGNTANTSYKKSILEKFGGFDEKIDFTGLVDWGLKARIMKSGYNLLYVPLSVLHLKPLEFSDVVRKFFNFGRGSHYLVSKNPEFIYYFPSVYKYRQVMKILRKENGYEQLRFKKNIHLIRAMAWFDFFFSRLGWEYQKIQERLANLHEYDQIFRHHPHL